MTLASALNIVQGERGAGKYAALRSYIHREYPVTIRALRLVDNAINRVPEPPKGYSLVRRENKKLGYVYYVRYRHNGKTLPSKWNTGTNVREEAERFARENRERLVGGYLACRDTHIYKFFESFFWAGSECFLAEQRRNKEISDGSRKKYLFVLVKRFVPFLKEKKITRYEQIDAGALNDFQDWLLALGLRPQSVNDNFKAVRKAIRYLVRKGEILDDPCIRVKSLIVRQKDRRARGCYEIDRLRGIFTRKWGKREESRLLTMLIYTTGMRNGEIQRIKKEDIKVIGGSYFIDVKASKTENGVRLVPLHSEVRKALLEYAADTKENEYIFKRIGVGRVVFSKANKELAEALGAVEYIKEENITFYSGRHYWKTLMSREGLGADVEELFMGHKVSGNVALLYDHRDKRGKAYIAASAMRANEILDKTLFSRDECSPCDSYERGA